jgi:hypothetical protein
MAAHALADYVHPCAEDFNIDADPPKETVLKVDKITVSDLQLGRNTSRSAYIERLTTLTVIGHSPDPALQAIALSRRAAPPPQPMVSFVSWLACKPQILAHTRSLYPPFLSALQARPRQTCSSGFQRAWHATLLSTDLRGPLARSLTSPSELRNIEDKTH